MFWQFFHSTEALLFFKKTLFFALQLCFSLLWCLLFGFVSVSHLTVSNILLPLKNKTTSLKSILQSTYLSFLNYNFWADNIKARVQWLKLLELFSESIEEVTWFWTPPVLLVGFYFVILVCTFQVILTQMESLQTAVTAFCWTVLHVGTNK